jgi:hypothetical protein
LSVANNFFNTWLLASCFAFNPSCCLIDASLLIRINGCLFSATSYRFTSFVNWLGISLEDPFRLLIFLLSDLVSFYVQILRSNYIYRCLLNHLLPNWIFILTRSLRNFLITFQREAKICKQRGFPDWNSKGLTTNI